MNKRWLTGPALLAVLQLAGCAGLPGQGAALEPEVRFAQIPLDPATRERAELFYDLLVAELAGRSGDLSLATEYYLRAARESDDPRVAEQAARVALYRKDYKRALAATERWLALDPDNMEAHQTAGLLLMMQHRPAEATEHFIRFIDASDDKETAFAQLSLLFARKSLTDEALAVLGRLRTRYPQVSFAHKAYAEVAFRAERLDDALAAVDEALRLAPDDQAARILRDRILLASGRVDEALRDMKRMVTRHPRDVALLHNYARMLVQAERYEDALDIYQRARRLAPDDLDLVYATALLQIELKRYDAARANLERLLESPHRRNEAAYYLGRIAEAQKHYDEAIAWYSRLQQGEYSLDAQLRIARLLAKLGQIDAAREHLARLRNGTDSEAVQIRTILTEGEILREAGRYQDAWNLYDRYLKLHPDSIDLLYARGMVAEKIGRLDLLERDLRAVLKRDPENASALNALGYTLADRTDRYQEAYDLIKRALAIRPDDPAILDSMGWVLYRLGRLEEAERYLRQALDKLYDPEIAYHLVEVLLAQDRREEAQKVLDKARAEFPDDERLKRVAGKLAS